MGKENVIITGNQTANSNQFTGGGGGGTFPIPSSGFQYARVVKINKDRSINYEMIQNNLGTSAINNSNKITGLAYSFNPNFTRLPKEGELVPIIKGPSRGVGNLARMYDSIDYYLLSPISVQLTVDDNKVPKDNNIIPNNIVREYKLNDIGINQPTPNNPPVYPSQTPLPSISPSLTPSPTIPPSPTPQPSSPTQDTRGIFRGTYTNKSGQQFDLYSKKSGFNTTIYAYKKDTNILVATGSPSSTAPIEVLINEMKLILQDNVYS